MRATAQAYRAFAHEHPGLYSTLHSTPGQGEDPEVYAAFAAVLPDFAAVLAGLGVPEADTVPLIRVVRSALQSLLDAPVSSMRM